MKRQRRDKGGELLLSLDAGTGSVRGLLFDLEGRCVGREIRQRSYQPDPSGKPFMHVFDSDALWQAMCDLIRSLLAKARSGPESILAVSTSCQRFSYLFLDEAEEVLYAGPNFDPRGIFTQPDIEARLGTEFYRVTGQWPPFMSGLSRILWFREEAPEVFRRIRTVFMLGDWMSFRLSGERTGEVTAASASGFLELATPSWSAKVLQTFGLEQELFPRVVFPGEVIGQVHARAAGQTGLRPGTPVVSGAGDTQCALLGSGLWGPDRVGIVTGTTACVCRWVDSPIIDPEQRIWTSWHMIPGSRMLEANSQFTGRIYHWLRDFFTNAGVQPGKGLDLYDWMETQASGIPPGACDTFACLGPILMDAKVFHAVRPGVFLFPPPGHLLTESPAMPGHLIRATLENIAFCMRGNLELVCSLKEDRPNCLFVTGGLCKSRLFCQILADCTGLPIRVGRELEGSALGAAVCAAAGIKVAKELEGVQRQLVHLEHTFEPSAATAEIYQPIYQRWVDLYTKIDEL